MSGFIFSLYRKNWSCMYFHTLWRLSVVSTANSYDGHNPDPLSPYHLGVEEAKGSNRSLVRTTTSLGSSKPLDLLVDEYRKAVID